MLVWTRETFSEEKVHESIADQYKQLLAYLTWLTTDHPYRRQGRLSLLRLLAEYLGLLTIDRSLRPLGHICPFMAAAFRNGCVYFVPASLNVSKTVGIESLIRQCVAHLKEQAITCRTPMALAIFFPETFPMSDITAIRNSLNEFVRSQGYLISAMPSPSLGLYDASWQPFMSSVKMLAIRDMVPQDASTIQFTGGFWLRSRLRFIRHLLRRLEETNTLVSDQWVQRAHILRKKYRRRIFAYVALIGLAIIATLIANFAPSPLVSSVVSRMLR